MSRVDDPTQRRARLFNTPHPIQPDLRPWGRIDYHMWSMRTGSDYVILEDITRTLLDPAAEYGALRDACVRMHELFTGICGLDDRSEVSKDTLETRLPLGKAISPVDAGRCVLDFMRTTKFLRGVRAAIDQARSRFPGEVIEVLYAGCGPFATLALPLTTVFSPNQVRFTLLDIHQRSLGCATRIAESLGVSSYFGQFVQTDATTYKCDGDSPIRVLIIETMQMALTKEPQVAIAMNLVPQLGVDGILIPEKITLTVCHADLAGEVVPGSAGDDQPGESKAARVRGQRVILGSPFELTAESAQAFASMPREPDPAGSILLPCRRIEALAQPEDSRSLAILTTITVFGDIVLGDYESGLTNPTFMAEALPTTAQSGLQFAYRLGPEPGLTFRVEPPT